MLVFLLAVSVLFVPSAGAFHGNADPSDWFESCGDGWTGLNFEGSDNPYVCWRFDVTISNPIPDHQPSVEQVECPGDFEGQIVTVYDSAVGACAKVVYDVPTIRPWVPSTRINTADCELPDEEWDQSGGDPVIEVNDGGVAFCVVPIVEPPDAGVEVSTEPCERRTVDPEVRAAGNRVQVCLDFQVLGLSSEDVNDEIDRVNETAQQVLSLVP